METHAESGEGRAAEAEPDPVLGDKFLVTGWPELPWNQYIGL